MTSEHKYPKATVVVLTIGLIVFALVAIFFMHYKLQNPDFWKTAQHDLAVGGTIFAVVGAVMQGYISHRMGHHHTLRVNKDTTALKNATAFDRTHFHATGWM